MSIRAAVGLGSNLGDRREHLAAGVAGLARLGRIVAVSPLYETAPVGGPDQGAYLNAVVVLETDLAPRALLEACLDIERSRGRERQERWGPRTLDLDLLLYGEHAVDEPGLTVPHPRLGERRFVLAPLSDVVPDARLPDGTPIGPGSPDTAGQQVQRIDGEGWWRPPPPSAVLEEAPPEVAPEEAARVAASVFGLDGAAAPLEGERDRNFLLVSGPRRYSLKIANPAQDPSLLEMQQSALEHLAAADPRLAVPRAVRTRTGGLVGEALIDGVPAAVRLQTFLPGDRLPDGHSTPASRRSLAALLARLDRGLEGFFHPGGLRHDMWDLAALPGLRAHTGHLDSLRRRVVEDEIDHFESSVGPALATVPGQMIHSDANPANLLTHPGDPDRITGIVDFGDLVWGSRAAEVGIAAAYQCLYQDDPAAVVEDLASAYHGEHALAGDERALVPLLAAARLAQSLVISAWRSALHPENREYILLHAEPAFGSLLRLREQR